jgi:hypothetical protein
MTDKKKPFASWQSRVRDSAILPIGGPIFLIDFDLVNKNCARARAQQSTSALSQLIMSARERARTKSASP